MFTQISRPCRAKAFIAIAIVILVALMAIFWPRTQSPMADIKQLEAKKQYAALTETLYSRREPVFSKKIIPWLKDREGQGFAPFYYATALHLQNIGEHRESILYYTTAALVARIDALHCADPTAERVIALLEKPFEKVEEYFEAHPGTRVTSGTWAMVQEESVKDRSLPEWLCSSGDKKLRYAQYIDEEKWNQAREEYLEAFRENISEKDQ